MFRNRGCLFVPRFMWNYFHLPPNVPRETRAPLDRAALGEIGGEAERQVQGRFTREQSYSGSPAGFVRNRYAANLPPAGNLSPTHCSLQQVVSPHFFPPIGQRIVGCAQPISRNWLEAEKNPLRILFSIRRSFFLFFFFIFSLSRVILRYQTIYIFWR